MTASLVWMAQSLRAFPARLRSLAAVSGAWFERRLAPQTEALRSNPPRCRTLQKSLLVSLEPLECRSLLAVSVVLVDNSAGGPGINSTEFGSYPSFINNIGGVTYFVANDGAQGEELWRLNGTGRAEMLSPAGQTNGLRPGALGSSPANFTDLQGVMYFTANDGVNGTELWRVAPGGNPELVEDQIAGGGIRPGGASSDPTQLFAVGDTLYFAANDGLNGTELWRVRAGQAAQMVEAAGTSGGIAAGNLNSNPKNLKALNGVLFFSADDNVNGFELWRLNAAGIAALVDDDQPGVGIRPGAESAAPELLAVLGNTLFFKADDGTQGAELWRVTAEGNATIVSDAQDRPGIRPGPASSQPSALTPAGGRLYFVADDASQGVELWRVGETGPATLVEDAVAGGGIAPGAASSNPVQLTAFGEQLYFAADDGTQGIELWRTNANGIAEMVDGAELGKGIRPGPEPSYPVSLTIGNGGLLYLSADDGVAGRELFRVNAQGRVELVDVSAGGGGIFPGAIGSRPYDLINVGGTLYFDAQETSRGRELWRVGSSGQAEFVGEVSKGISSSYPGELANVNGVLYFSAFGDSQGRELWRVQEDNTVNTRPIAANGGPYLADKDIRLNFSAIGSSDAESPFSALTFEWDFNYDGVRFDVDATGATPSQVFDRSFARRNIAVRVTDPGGLSSISVTTLRVRNPADFNDDDRVDITDFVALRRNFGKAANRTGGDANGDGRVDINDFIILRRNFGQ